MNSDLIDFIESLSTSDPSGLTPADVDRIRWYIKSDGCSGVLDIYVDECIKHDFYYRTKHDFSGRLISKKEADLRFREGIQRKSKFGAVSPLAWWRWLGVTLFPQAHRAWSGNTSCHS